MKDALIVSLLSVMPRKRGARTMGWFARTRASRLVVRAFVRAYGVDLAEARGELSDYPTLEALFTRQLAEGCRPIHDGADVLVGPVDGRVAFAGRTVRGLVEVAPGRSLDVGALLGEALDGERDVAVLYLSPTDYHRVHVPFEGSATAWRYVAGTLWPVFPAAVRRVRGLFSRNERVIVHFETSVCPIDVVLVGAFGVGRIEVVVTDLLTNTGLGAGEGVLDPPVALGRGDLLGVFHLGSTVVVVAPPGYWTWAVDSGDPTRVGQPLARRVRAISDRDAP